MNRAQHAYPLVLLPARFYPRESCQWLTDKFCQFRAFLRWPMNLGMKAIFTCQVNGDSSFFCFFVYRYFIRMVWFCRCRRALGGDGIGINVMAYGQRSEERRVGKEWCARCLPHREGE